MPNWFGRILTALSISLILDTISLNFSLLSKSICGSGVLLVFNTESFFSFSLSSFVGVFSGSFVSFFIIFSVSSIFCSIFGTTFVIRISIFFIFVIRFSFDCFKVLIFLLLKSWAFFIFWISLTILKLDSSNLLSLSSVVFILVFNLFSNLDIKFIAKAFCPSSPSNAAAFDFNISAMFKSCVFEFISEILFSMSSLALSNLFILSPKLEIKLSKALILPFWYITVFCNWGIILYVSLIYSSIPWILSYIIKK